MLELFLIAHREGEIEIAVAHAAEQAAGILAADLQARLADLVAAFADDSLELGLGKKVRDAEPDHRNVRLLAATRDDLVVDRQDTPRLAEHLAAAYGQLDARHVLFDEVGANDGFQPPHVRADSRLGEPEQMRRLGETAELADGDEGAQQIRRNAGAIGRRCGVLDLLVRRGGTRALAHPGFAHCRSFEGQRCFRRSATDASVVRLRLKGETKRPCLSIR